ncbi:MAG: site-2 protease family protein [Elusimicrobia bacterium]|nr:site-2 protease family protein [Elusimicrobiota bacterium]
MIHHLQSAVAVIFTFGLVIFLHELGHFLMCIKLGVRVERFAFGFGPELIGVTHNGTRLSICALPLGGFVKPAGDNLEDCTGEPNEYFSKTWLERLGIVAAGPFMNYVLAFTLFSANAIVMGVPQASSDPVIGDVEASYPAALAGVRSEDRILKVAGADVATWEQMADAIHQQPGKPVELSVSRGKETLNLTVTPRLDPVSGHGLIGIRRRMEFKKVGVFASLWQGAKECWIWTRYTVTTLAEKIYKRERPDVAGPVGIVQMVSRAAHSSFEDLVYLIALISVAVGFFNLLPVPLLDGGWGALYLWEGISRRKLTTKTMATANSVGLVFLLSLLLFATYNDLLRIRQQRRENKASKPAAEQTAPKP